MKSGKTLKFKKGEVNIQDAVNMILNEYRLSEKEEVIIVNIGTDKVIGDSYGPLLGTLLEDSECSIPFYGTLNEPIHALNFSARIEEIKSKHPRAFVISVDACLGDREDIFNIVVRSGGISPGQAVGKQMGSFGDVSVVAMVDDINLREFFTSRSIRLGDIMNLSKDTCRIFNALSKEVT